MNKTWAVVAERSSCRIFERRNVAENFALTEEMSHPEGRLKNHDLDTDSPGVSLTVPRGDRHTFSPHKTAQELIADQFARTITELLEKAAAAGKIQKLILLAEPKFLGLLKKHLGRHAQGVLTATVEKDLGSVATSELPARLKSYC